jgi:YD repeat-containing protein
MRSKEFIRRFTPHAGLLALFGAATVLAEGPASVTYTYDDAGRLVSGTFSDGKTVQYGYDAAGNRVSMTQGVPVQLSIAGTMPGEGAMANFTVTKTGTALGTVTVDCVQTPGSAAAGSDYTPNSQTLTFLAADTTKTCSVQTVQDNVYEQNQTFSAILQNVTGAAFISTGSATGTINDDDPGPVFSVSSTTGTNAEGGGFNFTISKSGTTELSHNVGYSTTNGTATASDSDFTTVANNYTFGPSETSIVIGVTSTQDSKYELNETFALSLSGPTNGSSLGTSSASATITNDDAAPSFSINNPAVVSEGALLTFTVTKGGNTNTGVNHSFSWATANNTAVSPSDYTAASGTVDFAPGDATRTIQVQTVTDGVADSASNETFFVNLTTNGNSNGGTLSVSQGIGTIADLNGTPTVPANIRKSPTTGTGGSFSILWDASAGTVNHYTLEETESSSGTPSIVTYTVTGTSKTFSKTGCQTLTYRVRACATSNETQCSAYSGSVFKQVGTC